MSLLTLILKNNNINILNNENIFNNIIFILDEVLNIVVIFIIYKFFDIKANKQNCGKMHVYVFYIPYIIVLSVTIIIRYVVK